MLEKWKSATGNGRSFGAILANLPKLFDPLRDLLIAKLNTYGFNMSSIQFAHTLESRIIGGVGIIGRGGGRGGKNSYPQLEK